MCNQGCTCINFSPSPPCQFFSVSCSFSTWMLTVVQVRLSLGVVYSRLQWGLLSADLNGYFIKDGSGESILYCGPKMQRGAFECSHTRKIASELLMNHQCAMMTWHEKNEYIYNFNLILFSQTEWCLSLESELLKSKTRACTHTVHSPCMENQLSMNNHGYLIQPLNGTHRDQRV